VLCWHCALDVAAGQHAGDGAQPGGKAAELTVPEWTEVAAGPIDRGPGHRDRKPGSSLVRVQDLGRPCADVLRVDRAERCGPQARRQSTRPAPAHVSLALNLKEPTGLDLLPGLMKTPTSRHARQSSAAMHVLIRRRGFKLCSGL
jgi:hypothetical protein